MSTREAFKRYAVLCHEEGEAQRAYIKAKMVYDAASAASQIGWHEMLAESDGLDGLHQGQSVQWLTVIEIDDRWYSPTVVAFWLTVDLPSETRAIAIPVPTIKAIPHLFRELDACLRLLEIMSLECSEAAKGRVLKRIDAINEVVAKATPVRLAPGQRTFHFTRDTSKTEEAEG